MVSFYLRIFLYVAALVSLPVFANDIHPQFFENLAKEASQKLSASSLCYNRPSGYLAIGGWDGQVDIWDTKKNTKIRLQSTKSRIDDLDFSDDGKLLFSQGDYVGDYRNRSKKIWDTKSGALLKVIYPVNGPLVEVQELGIFVVAEASSLRILERESLNLLTFEKKVGGAILSLDYHHRTKRIAVGTASGTVEIFELKKFESDYVIDLLSSVKPYNSWVKTVAFDKSGQKTYSLSRDGELDEWTTEGLTKLRRIPTGTEFLMFSKYIPEINSIAIAGGSNVYYSYVVSLDDGKVLKAVTESNLTQLDYLPTKSALLRIDVGGRIDLFNISSTKIGDSFVLAPSTPPLTQIGKIKREEDHLKSAESRRIALNGKSLWNIFTCSTLALKAEKFEEQDRIFRSGHIKGKKFLAALQKSKLEQKDFHEIPYTMQLLIRGPNPDFILGRIFESAYSLTLKEIKQEVLDSGRTEKEIAEITFLKLNCQSIDKGY